MKNKLRQLLANFVYKHVFNGVTENDILRGHAGNLYYGKTQLSSAQVNGIIDEARSIHSTELWKLLCNNMRNAANEKIFRSATSMEEISAARASLWTVDVLEKTLTTLKQMKRR